MEITGRARECLLANASDAVVLPGPARLRGSPSAGCPVWTARLNRLRGDQPVRRANERRHQEEVSDE